MIRFVAVVFCVGSVIALPLDTAVSNGVLLEEKASRPTFAKGIRTDCDYVHHRERTLGDVPARGDLTDYKSIEMAKRECDRMGPDCGGILETTMGTDPSQYRLYSGHVLKLGETNEILHMKTVCAFPLPYSNLRPGEGRVNHGAIWEENMNTIDMRWKLSNGPIFSRHDDGRDHGRASRLLDGHTNVRDIETCIDGCAKRSDCASGYYCADGDAGVAGTCFLSGDWDPHGVEVNEMSCNQVQNFRKRHDWVKPVLRLENGQHIKEQWHSKLPIDEAQAMDNLRY